MNNNLYVDINVLQTVPSSNINRDDTGAPKTALYGGVMRSRVSSQSWKRAVRQMFKQESNGAEWLESSRTLKAPELLAHEIQAIKPELDDGEAMKQSLALFQTLKIKLDKKTNTTKALLMLSKGQLKKLAQYIVDNGTDNLDKKALKPIVLGDQSLDLALFGRMVADDPSLNVDASCQVAHAISTHEVATEFDYYTAVDDAKAEDQAGSAMIGTIEYNSSTLYRYANVNVNELAHNIGNDLAVKGLGVFIKDFIMSMPTGKENTFANKTVPQYVMVTVRKDTPVNLVSAFEEPVRAQDGYVKASVQRLENEYSNTLKFVEQPIATFALTNQESSILHQVDSLSSLIDQVSNQVKMVQNDENNHD